MKRASYPKAVELIALNDEPTCLDVDTVSGFATVVIVAELFGRDPHDVAVQVVLYRRANGLGE